MTKDTKSLACIIIRMILLESYNLYTECREVSLCRDSVGGGGMCCNSESFERDFNDLVGMIYLILSNLDFIPHRNPQLRSTSS